MGSVIQTGYTLPGGNEPLTHARILHDRNRFLPQIVSASSEVSGFESIAAENGLTYDAWVPFSNLIADESDLSAATWTVSRGTLGADGQTFTEDTTTGVHGVVSDTIAVAAVEHVVSAKVVRETAPGFRFTFIVGATTHTAAFDLTDGTVRTATNATGKIKDLGGNTFECTMYFTPAAGSDDLALSLEDSGGSISYTGTSLSLKVLRVAMHESEAWLRYDLFDAATGDTMAVAGHNLGTGQTEITFQHDSDEDDTFTDIEAVSPSDNGPVFLIHGEVTSKRWRVRLRRGVLPKISVFRVGAALQMQRPIYGGHTPLDLGRQTILRTNYSGTGEVLGRSKERSFLSTAFEWRFLTAAWVRANWSELQRAVEDEPFFIAWRPDTFNEAGYCQTDAVPVPSNTGQNDFMNVSMRVRGLGYD